jgi:hypothetical protein
MIKKANDIPHQIKSSGAQSKPIIKGMKRVKKDGYWTLVKEAEGIASSGKNSAEPAGPESSPMRNMYQFGKKTGKKPDTKKKAATPPPDFYDQRMGAVPSGGVGLTVSEYQPRGEVIQEKSFEKFRKNISSIINNVDGE